jgi:hypothetical protein
LTADRRKDEEERPVEPALHDLKMLAQRIAEHDDQEDEQSEGEIGDRQ